MDFHYLGYVHQSAERVKQELTRAWDYETGESALAIQPRFGIWPREGAVAQLSLDTIEVELSAPVEVRESTPHALEFGFPTDPLEGVSVRFEWHETHAMEQTGPAATRTVVTGRIISDGKRPVGGEFRDVVERALENVVSIPLDSLDAALPAPLM